MRSVPFNKQRDNLSSKSGLNGYSQCFATAVFMLMGWLSHGKIDGTDDRALREYMNDTEAVSGGYLGTDAAKRYPFIKGHSTFFWQTHELGMNRYLGGLGIPGKAVFRDGNYPIASLPLLVKERPVVIGTYKLGGLPGGHIILLVDYDVTSGNYIVNDPFGDAMKNYADPNGDSVSYPEWILRAAINTGNGLCRVMWWED